ncbi:hypothetical protein [Xylocopilactobacillus apis]|uniref:Uncharacterized protein n=1 Tax=Xylocopilactobacillus apis TaxID=2932183 RepID=A0AAU9CUJ8_9LACO|nr:hypothetical protein [Xylocopilactobacillus apis]BDR56061.1 hypothetical protein KIMC2_06230 [Xylocopilactobacillus apis]
MFTKRNCILYLVLFFICGSLLNFQNVAAEIIPYHEVHSAVSLDDDSTSSSSSTSDSSSSSSDSNTKFSDLNPTLQGIVFRILMSVAMIFVVLLLIVLFIRSKSERFFAKFIRRTYDDPDHSNPFKGNGFKKKSSDSKDNPPKKPGIKL